MNYECALKAIGEAINEYGIAALRAGESLPFSAKELQTMLDAAVTGESGMKTKLERHIERGGTKESFHARQEASRAGTARYQAWLTKEQAREQERAKTGEPGSYIDEHLPAPLVALAESEIDFSEEEHYVAEHMLQLEFKMLNGNGDIYGCTLSQVLALLRARCNGELGC